MRAISAPLSVASIHAVIRHDIILLRLRPGTRVSENELARRFGTSRTPVREALLRLVDEGLVEVWPQRGTFITPISLLAVRRARFVREAMEVAILRQAAEQGLSCTRAARCRKGDLRARGCARQAGILHAGRRRLPPCLRGRDRRRQYMGGVGEGESPVRSPPIPQPPECNARFHLDLSAQGDTRCRAEGRRRGGRTGSPRASLGGSQGFRYACRHPSRADCRRPRNSQLGTVFANGHNAAKRQSRPPAERN